MCFLFRYVCKPKVSILHESKIRESKPDLVTGAAGPTFVLCTDNGETGNLVPCPHGNGSIVIGRKNQGDSVDKSSTSFKHKVFSELCLAYNH